MGGATITHTRLVPYQLFSKNTTYHYYLLLELGSLNRAISLGVERTLFSVESAGLYFWRMRTSFVVECLLRVLNRRASPWQKQVLNKLDASSMETTRIREPQGPLVASSLRSERYSPGPLRLSNARSFLDSTSNLYLCAHVVGKASYLLRDCRCETH